MRKEIEPYSKKKSIIILVIGSLGIIVAFACLLTAAIMQSSGIEPSIYVPFGIAFFPISIADLVFLIYHHKGLILKDINEQMENRSNIEIIDNINLDGIFEARKIKKIEEYYHIKRISLAKDYINYYLKKCISDNIEETIENEFEKFDEYGFKKTHKCLVLFLEKSEVLDSDCEKICEISNTLIASEIVQFPLNSIFIIVLIDKNSNKAYMVKPGKNKISFYASSFRFVKKILCKKI